MAYIFVVIGAAFVLPTISLAFEFGVQRWLDLAAVESSQFVYFPTFGLLALVAFFLPSCIFADLYWRHLRLGKFRLLVTFVIGAVVAIWLGDQLVDGHREYSLVGLSPKVLDNKLAENSSDDATANATVLSPAEILQNVRTVSKSRIGLTDFIHNCSTDPFRDQNVRGDPKRFCFVSTSPPASSKQLATLVTSNECCKMQEIALSKMSKLKSEKPNQSLTGAALRITLPLQVFFFGMMILVTIHLGIRRNELRPYSQFMEEVELRIAVGIVAMMVLLVMAYSQVQTEQAIFGLGHKSSLELLLPYITAAFLAAGLFVSLFFYNMHNQELERMGKIVGVISTGVAYVKFDELVAVSVRGIGSGIALGSFLFLVLISLSFSTLLFLRPAWIRELRWRKRTSIDELTN